MIYLNNAATSWPKPEGVYQKADTSLRQLVGSVNRGINRGSLDAAMAVLETRELLASFFNIREPENVVFTCNATAALNLALQGLLEAGDHVIISSMEHNAVVRPLYALKKMGVDFTIIPCAADGTLDPRAVEKAVEPRTRLICLTHASNVTGTIMPIFEVGEIARRHHLQYLVDTAQTAGEIPIDVEAAGITLLAFTGHKGLLGPPGTGGLYIRYPDTVNPLIYGGTGSNSELPGQPEIMPDKYESGTINAPAIAALGAGVKFIQETGLEEIRRHTLMLTGMLLEGLRQMPEVTVYGPAAERRVAVVSINIRGIGAGEAGAWLAEHYEIVTRSGLHCAPLAHRTIGTLATGTLRLSPGYFNTPAEIEATLAAIRELIEVVRDA
ncbi:aminotransferase class V-fold PLP-dependent enzyme [Moorella sulfitireducens]|uniref:aminotransferase class V-fold PLP-dependent enzyme n=1 Tax=Neomoorella sulfitireducens TaxID=2972948 RepID=UPI0021AC6F7D|nr:aminotransferase class V-fold PLP-dependent enzyme [Moorella sulfitireducens]